MRRLRLLIFTATLVLAISVGSGSVLAGGIAWCELGSPPPMDTPLPDGGTLAPNPQHNPNGMPTPLFDNANGKFVPNTVAQDENGQYSYLLPPGMVKAASGK
ncbi:MAG: hypothetical protein ACYC5J_09950 [Chloroflexota bacterium]